MHFRIFKMIATNGLLAGSSRVHQIQYSAPHTASWFKGALLLKRSKGKGRKGVGEGEEGEGREEEGRKVETPFHQFLCTPLA